MKFILKPSLEHIALFKIVISLWNQNDVRALISKLSFGDLFTGKKWKIIEERVVEKVPQLSLPRLLKEKVLGFVKPIGKQIFEWMLYYNKHDGWIEFDLKLDLPAHLPTELCWTTQGTLDRKKTAEILVKDESLDVSRRYRLACDYCLEDDIFQLWNRLPEDIKDCDWKNSPVISFWSDNMERGGAGHISYKDVFNWSAISGNKVGAEYFLQKLTHQEREECLVETAKHVTDADSFRFLISEMDEEQQMEVFRCKSYRVLWCFLQWPWQSFFIEIANCMWDYFSAGYYETILISIVRKVRDGYKDWDYQKLFREFWQEGPIVLKSLITNEIDKFWLLPSLFDIKDKENIRLILKDTSLTVKKKLIYSDRMKSFCRHSVRKNEWDFLEFFIRECSPSKNEMLKFKEEFEKHMINDEDFYFKEHFATKKSKWDLLFCFSDDSIYKCN